MIRILLTTTTIAVFAVFFACNGESPLTENEQTDSFASAPQLGEQQAQQDDFNLLREIEIKEIKHDFAIGRLEVKNLISGRGVIKEDERILNWHLQDVECNSHLADVESVALFLGSEQANERDSDICAVWGIHQVMFLRLEVFNEGSVYLKTPSARYKLVDEQQELINLDIFPADKLEAGDLVWIFRVDKQRTERSVAHIQYVLYWNETQQWQFAEFKEVKP